MLEHQEVGASGSCHKPRMWDSLAVDKQCEDAVATAGEVRLTSSCASKESGLLHNVSLLNRG